MKWRSSTLLLPFIDGEEEEEGIGRRRWSKEEDGCSVYGSKDGCSVYARKNGCSVYASKNGCSVYASKNGCSVNARKKKRNSRREEDGCSVYKEEANGGSAVSV